jgi:non-ribosomal peptide synthetase component E (peptide arylation enzyme)
MSEERIDAYGADYFRAKGWWRDETLPGWLERATIHKPDSVAIAARDGRITYRELSDRVYKFASALRSL